MARIPGQLPAFLEFVESLKQQRATLRTYASRRAGTAADRYQREDEHEKWAAGPEQPRSVGWPRGFAQELFRKGRRYEEVLWTVALNSMMRTAGILTQRDADTIKKSVNRAYQSETGITPPRVPRGWWHADVEQTRGGLTSIELRWNPYATP